MNYSLLYINYVSLMFVLLTNLKNHQEHLIINELHLVFSYYEVM